MTQVPLARVPEVLEPAFAAGDPENEAKVQERANVERIGQMVHAIARGRFESSASTWRTTSSTRWPRPRACRGSATRWGPRT